MKRSAIQRKTPLKRRVKPRSGACTCDLPEIGQFDHGPFCPQNHNRLAEEWSRKLHAYIAKEQRPRKPLPRVSARGKARNAEYAKAKAAWRKQHDGQCEFRCWIPSRWHDAGPAPYGYDSPSTKRCTRRAQSSPHHMALRCGSMLCDTRFWMGICVEHHRFIHDHAREARRLGYLVTAPKQP